MLLSVDGCSTFFTQRPDDGCTDFSDLGGPPEISSEYVTALAVFDDRIRFLGD